MSVYSLLRQEFVPKFFRSEAGVAYLNRPKKKTSGNFLDRLSMSASTNGGHAKLNNKIEPRSNKDGFASPPNSPKGPAHSQSAKDVPRKSQSPRKMTSPGRNGISKSSPEPLSRP